jgi:hypothetical protein
MITITFDPADQQPLQDLIARCATAAAGELPEASQEEVTDRATQLVAAELARLADDGEEWALRVIDALGEP